MPNDPLQPIDFESIKQSVSILQVLDRYGITDGLKRSGDSLCGPCPLHGGHNPTQFRVSLSKNCFNCFGDCHGGGSVLDLVARTENVGIRQAALLIREWFGFDPKPERDAGQAAIPRQLELPIKQAARNDPLDFALTNLDMRHPYLVERGLHFEIVATFGLGYCSKGSMAGRVVIPIHDVDGNLVAYVGRWPGEPPDGIPKYKLPAGFRKSLEVFSLHRAAAEAPVQPLVVVEGFFGAISLFQSGIRRVVSVMGSSLSDTQAAKIANAATPEGSVIVLFDEDAAGRSGSEQAVRKLAPLVSAKAVSLGKPGLQPDMLSPAEIAEVLK